MKGAQSEPLCFTKDRVCSPVPVEAMQRVPGTRKGDLEGEWGEKMNVGSLRAQTGGGGEECSSWDIGRESLGHQRLYRQVLRMASRRPQVGTGLAVLRSTFVIMPSISCLTPNGKWSEIARSIKYLT